MNVKITLLLILTLAFLLRFLVLDSAPPGFNADEAALGYNAYSLLQTGKDEYGISWPLLFKSFGDYKPGLYVYLTLPFVGFIGLNEVAVRLPSVLLGTITVLVIYFLGKRIFNNSRVGILSALFLTISPWHLHFSRGAWETNVATFFISLGILLFLKALENSRYLLLSFLAFLASMYTYQSPRMVVPLLLLLLFLFYCRNLLKDIRKLVPVVIVIALLSVPLALQFTSGAGVSRFSGLSFLSDAGPSSRTNELRGEHDNLSGKTAQVMHNKLTAYGPSFLGHYLDHFTPDFLFINGDPLIRNRVPEAGQFYLIEAIFLLLGLAYLFKDNFDHRKLLLAWILVAPAASAMTYQTPNALRSLNLVIPLTLVIGFGSWKMIELFKNKLRYIVILPIIIFLLFEVIHYLESYYVHYPQRYDLSWEYGFKEMVGKLSGYEDKYNKVVITDRYDQPYILLLFFQKYDPQKYQPQAVLSPRDKFNFGTIRSFDKYEFRSIKPEEVGKDPRVLFVGTGEEIPSNAKIVDKVNFPSGNPAFIFAE